MVRADHANGCVDLVRIGAAVHRHATARRLAVRVGDRLPVLIDPCPTRAVCFRIARPLGLLTGRWLADQLVDVGLGKKIADRGAVG
jgi:hypothetical protein